MSERREPALLEVDGLVKTFAGRRRSEPVRAVDDVSFTLERGRTLAIVGESGAGKSTVARLVLGLVPADGGSVRFQGAELLTMARSELRVLRRSMQLIFQDPYSSLDPRITIGRSVTEPLKVHFGTGRDERAERAVELLGRVGLGPQHTDRLPHQLSGGQLQRVAIARALSVEPDLIVCDEAVAALDVSVRAQVLNLLLDIQADLGVSYLFITHDLGIVRSFADDLVVMKDGAVVEAGLTATIFGSPSHPYTTTLLAAMPTTRPRHAVPR